MAGKPGNKDNLNAMPVAADSVLLCAEASYSSREAQRGSRQQETVATASRNSPLHQHRPAAVPPRAACGFLLVVGD